MLVPFIGSSLVVISDKEKGKKNSKNQEHIDKMALQCVALFLLTAC